MSLLTYSRIGLYMFLTAVLLAQPLTLVTGLLALFLIATAVMISIFDYKTQVSTSERPDDMIARGTELDAIANLYGFKRKTFNLFGITWRKEKDEDLRGRLRAKLLGRP